MKFLSQNSTWRPEKHLAGNRSQKKIPFLTSKMIQKTCYLAGIIFIGTIIIFSSRNSSTVIIKNIKIDKKIGMKYILQWTSPNTDPFNLMGEGQEQFLKRKCHVNNCYITPNPNLLNSITDFDAILFHGPEFCQKYVSFPLKRSLHQKYVFASRESPAYYPLDSQRYDGIFNWTYAYKLNSDIYFGYIAIKDKKGEVIGPRQNMHWIAMKDMKAIGKDLRKKFNSKKLAAAWFVSNCQTNSGREIVALKLQKELAKHKLVLDIFSEKCEWPGIKTCPKRPQSFVSGTECLRKIETDYYFYLSFENSVTEDYVTEKLLNAVHYYAVPIVYGGANYSRFLPDGSYLDISKLEIMKIVNRIVEAINNKEVYYDFFRWTNHYSYHSLEEIPEVDYMCTLCRKINDDNLVKQISIYENIRNWWQVDHH